MRGAARVLVASLIVLASVSAAGCVTDVPGNAAPPGESATRLPDDAPPEGNVTFTGRVTDARSGAPLPGASVRIELVTGDPCGGSGTRVAWKTWSVNLQGDGAFGPVTLPAPQGNASFQVHADAPGHLNAAHELRVTPKRNASFHVPLALVPAGEVAFPFADAEGASAPGTVAWWAPGRAGAFRAGEAAPVVRVAAGPVEGILLDEGGVVVPWRAVVEPGERVNATRGNVTRVDEPVQMVLSFSEQRGGLARGAFVLVTHPATEAPVTFAVADGAGTARLDVPANETVLVHAAFPSPVVQRVTRAVETSGEGVEWPVLTTVGPACA